VRVFNVFSNLGLENGSRKEAFFYNHLYDSFHNHGIQTPRPLYVVLEDKGDLPVPLYLLGFPSDFRGVICLEDLGQCENFSVGSFLPENHAISSSVQLAQLHALNWTQPIHPNFPSEYKPDAYFHFF